MSEDLVRLIPDADLLMCGRYQSCVIKLFLKVDAYRFRYSHKTPAPTQIQNTILISHATIIYFNTPERVNTRPIIKKSSQGCLPGNLEQQMKFQNPLILYMIFLTK